MIMREKDSKDGVIIDKQKLKTCSTYYLYVESFANN